jgi:hypothetical protein
LGGLARARRAHVCSGAGNKWAREREERAGEGVVRSELMSPPGGGGGGIVHSYIHTDVQICIIINFNNFNS